MKHTANFLLCSLATALVACDSGSDGAPGASARADLDTQCDTATFPSDLWSQCEAENVAKAYGAQLEQLNPAFIERSQSQQQANRDSFRDRTLDDPSWMLPPALGNTPATPLCAAGMGPCVGDPFRYPEVDGPDGQAFYLGEAEVMPVVYYDRACARISARVWRPRHTGDARLPAVVIKNGSAQANEQLYWWAAQALVRAGYLVLSGDPRGQGRSDASTPSGEQGGNFNGAVFYEGLVDDIDFLLSGEGRAYPHESRCAGTYPTATASENPFRRYLDPERIGAAGHSYGAAGVTWAQSYDAPDSQPWPGQMTQANPLRVIVAWDALGSRDTPNSATLSSLFDRDGSEAPALGSPGDAPPVSPRVPALGFSSEYGFTPVPFLRDPPRDAHLFAYREWYEAGVPAMNLSIAGSTHLDYSLGPELPATSWCASVDNNACVGGWARPMITHYTVAWFDRWLKQPGEAGFDDADARLLSDADWAPRLSIHFASARAFPTRDGRVDCADIRLGCDSLARKSP